MQNIIRKSFSYIALNIVVMVRVPWWLSGKPPSLHSSWPKVISLNHHSLFPVYLKYLTCQTKLVNLAIWLSEHFFWQTVDNIFMSALEGVT